MRVDAEFVQGLIAELNELGEHTRVEAKTSSELGKAALETVGAFSNEPNLGGGHLLLGVVKEKNTDLFGKQPYVVVGVPDPEGVSAELANRCATEFNRPIRPRITPVKLPGGVVIHVFVEEARPEDKPIILTRYGSPRGIFRRTSEGDFKGTDEDLAVFYGERGGATYDREIVRGATLDDIDPDAIRMYRKLLEESGRSAEVLAFSDRELLEALGAVQKVDGDLKPTGAGLLLFGTRLALRRDFAMMRVDYLRVPGTKWVEDASNRYEALIEIRDPLFRALLRAETAVLDDLPKKFNLPEDSLQRQDILPLPRKVLREAIVNALMHRDYRVHGSTQIIRFADRIEIHNPGYSLKPPNQLGKPGSANRNPTIASVFHDTDLAETKGTGIGTMRRLMENAELAPPMFESERGENRFVAHIPLTHFLSKDDLAWLDGIGEELSAHERVVLVHVRDEGTINNEAVRKMTGLDSLAASTLLRRLCALDLLSKEAAGNATYYLPTVHFLDSLSEGAEVPGIGPAQPCMDEVEVSVPGKQPDKSGDQTGKSGAQPDKSDAQLDKSKAQPEKSRSSFSVLPPDLQGLVEGLRGKEDDAAMRPVIRRLCGWKSLSARELEAILGRTAAHLRTRYLRPMVDDGELTLTIPDRPRSRLQKYKTPDAAR